MKQLIALFLSLLLLVQAIPVAALLLGDDASVSWVDEDKPEDGKIKDKKAKEFLTCDLPQPLECRIVTHFAPLRSPALPCPYLERFTPPPNA